MQPSVGVSESALWLLPWGLCSPRVLGYLGLRKAKGPERAPGPVRHGSAQVQSPPHALLPLRPLPGSRTPTAERVHMPAV